MPSTSGTPGSRSSESEGDRNGDDDVLGLGRPVQPIEPRRDRDPRAGLRLTSRDRATLPPSELIEKTTGGNPLAARGGRSSLILARPILEAVQLPHAGRRLAAVRFSTRSPHDALEPSDPLGAPQAVVRLHRALATRPASRSSAPCRPGPVPDRRSPSSWSSRNPPSSTISRCCGPPAW